MMDEQKNNAEQAENTAETENKVETENTVETENAAPATPAESKTETQQPKQVKENAPVHHSARIALSVGFVLALAAALVLLVMGSRIKKTTSNSASAQTTATTQASETTSTEETRTSTLETEEPTTPEDGNPDDATCKGTYTASDEEVLAARDTVVATVGDASLTSAQLQVFYWMQVRTFLSNYSYYLPYFGLDYTQPLDTQMSSWDETMTWQQYFLQIALDTWQSYESMAMEAEKAGIEIDADTRAELDSLEEQMTETAESAGYDSVEDLVHDTLGGTATMEDYAEFMELYYAGYAYYTEVTEDFTVTDEEIEAFFDENEEAYEEGGVTKDSVTVDVRHILILPEGATVDTVTSEEFSDEAWAAAEETANEILDEWRSGEATEDSFAALAEEYSEDTGSNTNGGLYEDVSEGEMVTEFNDWCFDEPRQAGDVDIVKTVYGYHIMFFSSKNVLWKEYAEEDLLSQMADDFVEETAEAYPMTVDYSAIVLGYVDLES